MGMTLLFTALAAALAALAGYAFESGTDTRHILVGIAAAAVAAWLATVARTAFRRRR